MRTPEEITNEILSNLSLDDGIDSMIQRAVTLAREDEAAARTPAVTYDQISDLLDLWESYDGDVSHFIQSMVNHINNGTPLEV